MRLSLFLDGANFFYMQRDRLHWLVDWPAQAARVRTL